MLGCPRWREKEFLVSVVDGGIFIVTLSRFCERFIFWEGRRKKLVVGRLFLPSLHAWVS